MRLHIFLSAIFVISLVNESFAQEQVKRLSAAEWLKSPVSFNFVDTPLKLAVEKLNVQCVLAVKHLEEAAINVEGPISGKSRGISALDDLNELLRSKQLAAEIRHDVLFITTIEHQSSLLVGRIYRVREGGDPTKLVKQIIAETNWQSWSDVGGPGSIALVGANVITIFQAAAIHREIERKYSKQLLPVKAPADRIAALVPTKGPNPVAEMREALRRRVSAEFLETPLTEAVKLLEKRSKVKLVRDTNGLIFARINVETPVTCNLVDLPLESVLTLMLEGLGLAWTIDGDHLLITTPAVAESRTFTVVYDARDLAPSGDFDSLVKSVQSMVRPNTWDSVGGPGLITVADGALSITQSGAVHRAIELWLADVRQAMQPVGARK